MPDFVDEELQARFEEEKPDELRADIRMISGCQDSQTSADVCSVSSFRLPDPAGRGGGACTSTLLNILYKDETTPEDTMSFVEVLQQMREQLQEANFSQIPQLTASKPIDVNDDFDLVPPECSGGTRRAVMIGINYIGHESGVLSGCQNDAWNMKKYIENVHGFSDENIVMLLDDDEHTRPTKENILAALTKMVEDAEEGDALFVHYSGHGVKLRDDDGDEADGYDEALAPVDYNEGAGFIRDDDLYDVLVKPLKTGCSLFALYDCCHSGTILDLPYHFKADGEYTEMRIEQGFDFGKFFNHFAEAPTLMEGFLSALSSM